jgi:hypothetical protein
LILTTSLIIPKLVKGGIQKLEAHSSASGTDLADLKTDSHRFDRAAAAHCAAQVHDAVALASAIMDLAGRRDYWTGQRRDGV